MSIVCSMCNAYRPPRVQNAIEVILAERMLTLATSKNKLKERVECEGWARKRVAWKEITHDTLTDFLHLTTEELCFMTLGDYELKQAKSYPKKHLDDQGLYMLSVYHEDNSVIRVKIQSQHVSS